MRDIKSLVLLRKEHRKLQEDFSILVTARKAWGISTKVQNENSKNQDAGKMGQQQQNSSRGSAKVKVMIGQQQQLAESALPLLLARGSAREQYEGKMGQQQQNSSRDSTKVEVKIDQQQQLPESALPLLLARGSTRQQDKGKIGQQQQNSSRGSIKVKVKIGQQQ